ncbi:MAG TPA: TetR/AcrR family transcriptional regulator [Candidatus Limnocylindria bacterium]|jgi:AcrR family transcriptional regulator|nr:TetR/AcrR family transcriptional regulator [Candidatus Limnocylindria bacterium]
MKPANRPYHHGNLRQELLRAAEAALEARGVQQLSLRELSRKLGVSHASPQRHFATKQDLLNALATVGFQRFDAIAAKAVAARGQNFNARLTKVALAHLGFALKHPALLALMFEAKRQRVLPPELHTALQTAFSHLPRILQEGQEAGKIVPGDPYRLALTIAAVVQGLVAISVDGKIKGDSLKVIVPEVIGHVLNGLSTGKSKV